MVLKKTVSTGFSGLPFYDDKPSLISIEDIIKIADLGLYYSKSNGRDMAVEIIPENLPGNDGEIQKSLNNLEYALEKKFFSLEILN